MSRKKSTQNNRYTVCYTHNHTRLVRLLTSEKFCLLSRILFSVQSFFFLDCFAFELFWRANGKAKSVDRATKRANKHIVHTHVSIKASVRSLIWINFQVMHMAWSDGTSTCDVTEWSTWFATASQANRLICSYFHHFDNSRRYFSKFHLLCFVTLVFSSIQVIPFSGSNSFPSTKLIWIPLAFRPIRMKRSDRWEWKRSRINAHR